MKGILQQLKDTGYKPITDREFKNSIKKVLNVSNKEANNIMKELKKYKQ